MDEEEEEKKIINDQSVNLFEKGLYQHWAKVIYLSLTAEFGQDHGGGEKSEK